MTETGNSELCPKCRMPVTASGTGPGTITQWLFICRCNAQDLDLPEQSLRICSTCGKAISEGRKGTFTQFIFRAELCSCERPEAPQELMESMAARELDDGGTAVVDPEEEEEELPVKPELFPLERYKPVKELGTGATGKVYLARDRLLGKQVAVKTLHQMTGDDLIAFQEEAKATSLLNHEGIVKIIDFGAMQSGTPYMVLEYIPGLSLFEHLEKHKTLPWQVTVDIFIRVVLSLDYAHKEGILHRDVKPSNIIIYTNEAGGTEVKLIDFGVAQVGAQSDKELEIQGRTIVGTPHYMSPDQAHGYTFTSQSDMYSVGCVMYECLTGNPPFSAETPLELLRLHAEEEIPSLTLASDESEEVPEKLERIIGKCLAKLPEERYQSMEELLNELGALKQEALTGTVEEEEKSEEKGTGKKIILYTMLGILAVLLVGFPIYNTFNSLQDVPTEKKTEKPENQELKFGEEMEEFRRGVNLYQNNELLLGQMGEVGVSDLKDLDLSGVREVELDFCTIKSPETIKIIAQIPNMVRLVFPGGKGLTNETIETLARTYNSVKNRKHKLYSLDLNNSDIEPGSMKYISTMKSIRNLNVDSTRITDEDIDYIAQIPIVSLTVENTGITDKSLKKIASIKSLKSLHLDENRNLTPEAINQFKKARPDCIVRTWSEFRSRRTQLLPKGALNPR